MTDRRISRAPSLVRNSACKRKWAYIPASPAPHETGVGSDRNENQAPGRDDPAVGSVALPTPSPAGRLRSYLTLLYAPDSRVSLRAVHPDAIDAYASLAQRHGLTLEQARELPEARPYWAAHKVVAVGSVERRLAHWARELPYHNLYAQVASVRPGQWRGGLDSLECARALWVDVDGAAGVGSLDRLFALIEQSGVPAPSMIVRTSEMGWHCYWALAEPFCLAGPTAQHSFRRVLYGMAARLGGDLRATDPARVLRPPGTINHPSAAKRATGRGDYAVELVELNHAGPLYSRAELRPFAADPPPSVAVSDVPQYGPRPYAGELPVRVAVVLECDPDARDRFDGAHYGLTDASDSAIDLGLARRLAEHDLEGWEIEHAVRYSRETVRQARKRQDDRHYVRTVNRVLAEDDGDS